MKFSQIKNFITIIECGSVNRAAEKLYISQPTLSRSIQMLEAEIGTKLMERSNSGITSTPAGELFYFYGKSILKQLSTLKQIKNLDKDTSYSQLRLSTHTVFIKDELIVDTYKQLNSENTDFYVHETTAEKVFSDVTESKVEIGIVILNEVQLKVLYAMAEKHGIHVIVLDKCPIYVHMREDRFEEYQEDIPIELLKDITQIRAPQDVFYHLNTIVKVDGFALTDFEKTLTMRRYHSMLNVLKQTETFMLGHKWHIDELKKQGIKSLKLRNCEYHNHMVLIMRKDKILSKPIGILLEKFYEYYHLGRYAKKV